MLGGLAGIDAVCQRLHQRRSFSDSRAFGKHRASLVEAALLASMPNVGMMLTLIPWGYLLDRVGERIVLALGLALTAAAGFAAAAMHSMLAVGLFLVLGGMAAASTLAASGRLVTGWFAEHQRRSGDGYPADRAAAGHRDRPLCDPELAKRNLALALLFPAVLCAVAAVACALGVHDPPRPEQTKIDFGELADLYRGRVLWRIHAASALLMVPQPVVLTFMLVWFSAGTTWSMAWAGVLVGIVRKFSARWSALRPADGPTASARGCGRCARSASRPQPSCWCWRSPITWAGDSSQW